MAFMTPNQHPRQQDSFKVAKKVREMSTRLDPLCNSESKPTPTILPNAHSSERFSENKLRAMSLQNSSIMITDQHSAYGVPTK